MDPFTIIAVIAVLAALAAVFAGPKSKAKRPGRALIDHFEDTGKTSAGRVIEDRLGEQLANEIMGRFAALAPKPSPELPPTPPVAAPSPKG